jgi:hypothetical protein
LETNGRGHSPGGVETKVVEAANTPLQEMVTTVTMDVTSVHCSSHAPLYMLFISFPSFSY